MNRPLLAASVCFSFLPFVQNKFLRLLFLLVEKGEQCGDPDKKLLGACKQWQEGRSEGSGGQLFNFSAPGPLTIV